MGDVLDMAERVLVGHIQGRKYNTERIWLWNMEIWGQFIDALPFVISIPKGWFTLSFSRLEHLQWVVARYWRIEQAPVLLKRWSPLFDHKREHLGVGPIWVRLPGLPMQFWFEDTFVHIGNALRSYLDHDKSYIAIGIMTMARILVHLDTREDLEESITL